MAFRTDDPTKSANLFGSGKHGYTEGTPGAVLPTKLRADHLNSFQEEIANAVEGGGLTLDKTDYYQLLKVIRMQGAKSAFQLEIADDTGASQTLKGIARKPRGLTSKALEVAAGESAEIWKLEGGEAISVTADASYADAFTDVTYDATLNKFFMCGQNGEIQSYISGGTATQVDTGGSDTLNAIACDGTGKVVSVGEAGRIRYTSNGTAWSAGTDPSSGKDFDDVAFGAGLFVAVQGYSSALGIFTSPTGQTWTSREAPSGTPIGEAQVVYHSTIGFLAYSDVSTGTVYHSPDGITWTAIVGNASGGSGNSVLFAGPYCWGMATAASGCTSVRCYFGTGIDGTPYFDADFVTNVALETMIVLDGQIFGLFGDFVYVGGVL